MIETYYVGYKLITTKCIGIIIEIYYNIGYTLNIIIEFRILIYLSH